MLCSIYKSAKKQGAYLYITTKDDFSQVPDALLEMFGKPTLVMVVKLDGRTLAQVDVDIVKQSLQNEGFFLQLPPPQENLLDTYKEQKKAQKK
ncbi:YcgL domain-containing protein [Vibrio methylphosphonaticus]|uniref:YcgL domain-containing protein n=1 Tax=Vibrio methylphosphonaticus TaxID=2946866 RepID=UPI00202A6804|nr:YcgL domain-containing protein [Vibrio methylphosphonaticus]MCL9776198.1 YcgL domain-containing protein [Vibrio methylphosphonaticus]